MKTAILIAMCLGLGLAVGGCKKGKQPVKGGADTAALDGAGSGGVPDPSMVNVASGDMKDLLLALKRIHFALDAATLTDDGKKALEDAAVKLEALPKVELYVDGHTDDRGTTEYNMSLSERRAQTAVKYLTGLGIAKSRLNIVSFGEESPLASGSSEEDYAKNRRVDFRIFRGDIEFVLEDSQLVDDEGNPIR